MEKKDPISNIQPKTFIKKEVSSRRLDPLDKETLKGRKRGDPFSLEGGPGQKRTRPLSLGGTSANRFEWDGGTSDRAITFQTNFLKASGWHGFWQRR